MAKVVRQDPVSVFEVRNVMPAKDPDLDRVMPGTWRVREGCSIHTGVRTEGPFFQGTVLEGLTKRQLLNHGFKLERLDEPGKDEPDWLRNPSRAHLDETWPDAQARARATALAKPTADRVVLEPVLLGAGKGKA